MKRSLFSLILIFSMLFSMSRSIVSVQAGFLPTSPDLDQDGISATMESTGWYNLAGGPYKTNPKNADSDQDGLTDAEEKLFNTNPNDPKDPGISVKYASTFKTFEYYSANNNPLTFDPRYFAMVQGGDRYLLTEALVVRRGTTFRISAVNSSTATLTISGAGMTPITPVRDPARGGWVASIPAAGTVGTYTATIMDGAWSKSLPIYVIFELPSDLTQAQISAFLYDDDPANKRDETAVWWRAWDWSYYNNDSSTQTACLNTDPVCSDWKYHLNYGWAQAFHTEQFTKKVLVDFAIPEIQGRTTQYSAAALLGEKADRSVRVNLNATQVKFSDATFYELDTSTNPPTYHMVGGACETNAGVFTSLLRSVGIASRPFATLYNHTAAHDDIVYSNYEYDHAVMMWVKGTIDAATTWYAERSFVSSAEPFASITFPPDSPSWASGTTGLRHLADVGIYDPANPSRQFNHMQDLFSDLMLTVNEGWDFQNVAGGGMVNQEWDTAIGVPSTELIHAKEDYQWDSQNPLKMRDQSPYIDLLNCQLWRGDGWAPSEWRIPPVSSPTGRGATRTYYLPGGVLPDPTNPLENWPFNPNPNQCSPSSAGTPACTAFLANYQKVCTLLPGQTLASAQPQVTQLPQPKSTPPLNSSMQVGNIVSDAGLDKNGDGRFDKLTFEIQITSSLAGNYQLGGLLKAGEKQIRADTNLVTLTPGLHTVQVSFDGQFFGDNQIDGPYQLEAVWVAPADHDVSELVLPEEMLAYKTSSYTSQAYKASDFLVRAAFIEKNFAYSAAEKNTSGLIKSISITVPLNIAIPGTFTVEGDLYDGKDQFVGHATWTGSGPVAALKYEVAKTQPPYSLEHLNLLTLSGKTLDSLYTPVYTINDLGGKVDPGNVALKDNSTGLSPQAITPSNAFYATPVDANGNSRYEQLLVSTTVDVTGTAGSYWIEGLLVDDRGIPVAWGVGIPKSLNVGPNQTLLMAFEGRQLFDQLPLATSQKFTLVAFKIFSGSPGAAVVEVNLPVTGFSTPAYSRSNFELSRNTAFEDDLENGEAKWSKTGTAWSLVTSAWNSGSHAYQATGSGTLALAAPLNFSGLKSLWLRFSYASDLGSNPVELQVSTGGTSWTTLKTYTGLTNYWTTELVDLSAYAGLNSVKFRFNIPTPTGGMLWLLDDVSVIIGPYVSFVPVAGH